MSALFLLSTVSIWTIIASESPDCECISGYDEAQLDCTDTDTINTLEAFLSDDSIDCMLTCDDNNECQQSLSLLTQYYDYCPLGTVSQALIRSYWQSSTCTSCQMSTYYDTGSTDNDCEVLDCEDVTNLVTLQDSIAYITSDCSDLTTGCTTECYAEWQFISSFSRLCKENVMNFGHLLDKLYVPDTDCIRDCDLDFLNTTDADCSSAVNSAYADYSALDIDSLKEQTLLCFYGLNVEDPSIYELICVERADFNESGILSYDAASAATNDGFWGGFGIAVDMDQVWVLLCGVMVFFMQNGFSLLEAGAVKHGNVQNILFKNMMDACIGAIVWYTIGYCVAYGDDSSPDANGFIGVDDILIESEDWNSWFFQWAFAATAATIVSGAVAERCSLEAYFLYTIVISAWIYPVVVHWAWSGVGWISPFNAEPAVYAGAIDFAGSAVVHMVGGFCGLAGAYWLGPRFRRFEPNKNSAYHLELLHQFEFGHSVPFQALGTLILWFGWYGFNAGSTLAANGAMELASKVAVNTTLAAGAGGIVCCILARIIQKTWHIPRVCNGILAALVSITASCAVVSPGWAIAIGFLGGLVYYGCSTAVEKVKIDDPLDAFAVHGCGGAWGVLSAGIFGTDENIAFAGYSKALYQDTSHGERFLTQLTLVLAVAGWTLVNSGILFGVLYKLKILRVSETLERTGIDLHEHGGSAMNVSEAYRPSISSGTRHEGKNKEQPNRTEKVLSLSSDPRDDGKKESLGGVEEEAADKPDENQAS